MPVSLIRKLTRGIEPRVCVGEMHPCGKPRGILLGLLPNELFRLFSPKIRLNCVSENAGIGIRQQSLAMYYWQLNNKSRALHLSFRLRPNCAALGFNELARHIEPESRALDVCFACVFGAREFLEKMRSDFCADTNICIFYSCQEKQKGVLW